MEIAIEEAWLDIQYTLVNMPSQVLRQRAREQYPTTIRTLLPRSLLSRSIVRR